MWKTGAKLRLTTVDWTDCSLASRSVPCSCRYQLCCTNYCSDRCCCCCRQWYRRDMCRRPALLDTFRCTPSTDSRDTDHSTRAPPARLHPPARGDLHRGWGRRGASGRVCGLSHSTNGHVPEREHGFLLRVLRSIAQSHTREGLPRARPAVLRGARRSIRRRVH